MAVHLFSNEEFSEIYHKGMIPSSQKVMDLIMSYLEEKKGNPFDLAVDVGCGTGKYTRPLAAYFQKVIGIDISESQINVARRFTSEENVFYHFCRVSSTDNMPLKDASVDLINAGIAAHWFNIDKFIQEAARVLKQGGCLALHSFMLRFELHYKDISEILTNIFGEAYDILCQYEDKANDVIRSQYQNILESIPFTTKERITDIHETFLVTVTDVMAFFESTYMYQIFLRKDRDEATEFLKNLKKRLMDALGESSCQAKMEFHLKFFCILACKS